MTVEPAANPQQAFVGPLLVAFVALFSVVLTLDGAGDYPSLFEGPGITLDESFNVQMGVYQWNALREYHVALLHPDSVREVFGPGSNYNPDHPPLGRVWLGVWHDLSKWMFPPADHPSPFVTDCARVGSATAFVLTVFLIGLFATKWYGRTAGIVAAVSLVLMPRVFAHAHLASLETCMNLTYSAAILAVAHWWPVEFNRKRRGWIIPALTGALFGLALLTKMQAIVIPPVVGLWAIWNWRVRAIKPLVLFGLVGVAVFFVGWPWLWLDPLHNFREYFARTTSRAVLNCYYLGQVWHDKDVPWHYPFVMFAVTVPVGLHALGLCGVLSVGRAWRQPREQLLLAAALFPLVLFALPGVAVYDGERLFLISFPIWAVLIGRGAEIAFRALQQKTESGQWRMFASHRARVATVALCLLTQSVGVIVMHPCQLSYYNLLVGGLNGADRLGFERTYWGDSVTRSVLALIPEMPQTDFVDVIPVLHQFQLNDLMQQSPILRRKRIRLRSADFQRDDKLTGGWLVYTRKADVPPDVWGARNGVGLFRQDVSLAVWRTERDALK